MSLFAHKSSEGGGLLEKLWKKKSPSCVPLHLIGFVYGLPQMMTSFQGPTYFVYGAKDEITKQAKVARIVTFVVQKGKTLGESLFDGMGGGGGHGKFWEKLKENYFIALLKTLI